MKIKKILPVTTISSLNINAAPIVRIFELTTDITRQNQYKAVGIENLTTSIKTEKTELLQCMFLTKKITQV